MKTILLKKYKLSFSMTKIYFTFCIIKYFYLNNIFASGVLITSHFFCFLLGLIFNLKSIYDFCIVYVFEF